LKTNPVIRKALKQDIHSIVSFNHAMALETENISLDKTVLMSGVEAIFDNPDHGFYIVCEIDGLARGCLMITYEWSDWRNSLFWWVQSVYVHKEFRKQGLYKQMYTFIKTLVDKDENIAGVRLYVDKENLTAQIVYEALGMKKSNYQLFEYSKTKKTT
jgi:ribosomal protein S18 acetylase RimI-like enzyme